MSLILGEVTNMTANRNKRNSEIIKGKWEMDRVASHQYVIS